MSVEANKMLFRTYVRIWENGEIDELKEVLHEDYVGHPSSGDRDVRALQERIAAFRDLYSDVCFRVEDQLADEDKVATRLTATAKRASDGHEVQLYGLNICRVSAGKIIEEWMAWEAQPVKKGSV